MKKYKIAVIPGDGIGPEVIGETIKILERSGEKFGFSFEWQKYPRSRPLPGDRRGHA